MGKRGALGAQGDPFGDVPSGIVQATPKVRRRLTEAPFGRFDVDVPTEDGGVNTVSVTYNADLDAYAVQIGGAVFDESPEALTAAVLMAFRAIQSER